VTNRMTFTAGGSRESPAFSPTAGRTRPEQGAAQHSIQTVMKYPPMQKGASFNLEALKAELEKKMEMMKGQQGQ
jgi:hypothetical protein